MASKLLKICDQNDFWILVKTDKGTRFLTFTYGDDAPKWDLLPVLQDLVKVVNGRKPRMEVYNLTPLFSDLRALIGGEKSKQEVPAIVSQQPWENEQELLDYIIAYSPAMLKAYREA